MPVLLYCMVHGGSAVALPAPGVRNAAVESLRRGDLACLYSSVEISSPTQEDALDFHQVIDDVFQQVAVAPFRFPTILDDEKQLMDFLAGHAHYGEQLQRFQDYVQMEVSVTQPAKAPKSAQSGREYLESRKEAGDGLLQAATAAVEAAGAFAHGWRQKEAEGKLRCYALVLRSDVVAFRDAVRSMAVPGQVKVLISGPWPVTEFLEKSAA